MDKIMENAALFTPLTLGAFNLKNRIALPPLTRSRSGQPGNVANDLMAEYYAQRCSAGFMVSEGTQIEPRGQGYAWTPGIYTPEQIAGWKKVTDRVHQQGGVIFAQLWHVGRVSHTSLQPAEGAPVAPSAIAATNVKVFIETGPGTGALAAPSAPRALSTDAVRELVALYAAAARHAMEAGFDGVELHAANGYLINQFMSVHTNQRDDIYGGSLDNRLRFLREVTQAVIEVVGKERVGVRFAPLFESTTEDRVYLGLVEPDPFTTYITAARQLNELGIAYLSIAEADWDNAPDLPQEFYPALRETFRNVLMYAGKYTAEKASRMLDAGLGDLFGFGRTFIANPDLPARIAHGWPLNPVDRNTLFGGGVAGYTDYPVYRAK